MRIIGAVAALGAALIALAVGAAAAPVAAVPLLASGIAQAVIAVLALRGTRLPVAVVLLPLTVPTLVWLGALMVMPDGTAVLPLGPMLAESGLALAAAALIARPSRSMSAPRPLAAVLSLLGSAAVVAAVATAALAGTEAGQHAVPHGEHGGHGAQQEQAPLDPQIDESLLEEHGHH
ncbi:hypothetical protein [Agrococcus sp. ARC_14]|uniref:hypothetical protein n=1 Tax=Agrococcus sp. ARC_14 TaxID=2919927 RepID=UPI001F05D3ED|nr:hypothetical protein [Agrococcus sp. ARC_14]MCH1882787.1 hypothetical protein [Agrococcus sp. ARC_14]